MNDEVLLTLHCPQCKQITDVVTEGDNLVCLDCGHKFDERTAARLLGREPVAASPAAADPAA